MHHVSRTARFTSAVAILTACALTTSCGGSTNSAERGDSTTTSRAKGGAATSTTTSTTPAAHSPGHVHVYQANDSGRDENRPTIVDFGGADRAKLAAELVRAREVALSKPTVRDATAAGYELTTGYSPGTGAHFGRDDYAQQYGSPFDINKPQSFMYDGEDPTSRVVGLMYIVYGTADGTSPPDGFTGPLDTWRQEVGQCLKPGTGDPMFPSKSVVEKECTSKGGQWIPISVWILHVWVVPGWEAPEGAFASFNDDIVCADGTENADPVKGCPSPVKW